jgi:hypothetical protein
VPAAALVEAEKRVGVAAPNGAPRPVPNEGGAGKGPDDTADQQWFKATFCMPVWECIQGWDWANGSGGHHWGQGYAADGMNGSEARAARTLETDWWNGTSWSTLITESMPPGWTAWTTGGNTGAPACATPTCPPWSACAPPGWYFKSEIADNGTGDNATVSLADHMYSPQIVEWNTNEGRWFRIPEGCDGCVNPP